jgi:hypothetical protein
MTPQELIADLRGRINPAYAGTLGTESFERRLCADALEAQAGRIADLQIRLNDLATAFARICDEHTRDPLKHAAYRAAVQADVPEINFGNMGQAIEMEDQP